jgi:hypothetical protein
VSWASRAAATASMDVTWTPAAAMASAYWACWTCRSATAAARHHRRTGRGVVDADGGEGDCVLGVLDVHRRGGVDVDAAGGVDGDSLDVDASGNGDSVVGFEHVEPLCWRAFWTWTPVAGRATT